MAALYACGFNAHGQISPLRITSWRSAVTDSSRNKIREEDAEEQTESENGVVRESKVHDDVLRLQKMCAGASDRSEGALRVVFAGWSESAGAFLWDFIFILILIPGVLLELGFSLFICAEEA